MADEDIVAREELPDEGTLLFSVANGDSRVEGVLLELADGVVAFENYCQHWRDVRLDAGEGATMRNGEIVCEKHGAYFEADSGYCNYGPCEGAVLEEIEVAVEDGVVSLSDERYGDPRLGPAENGDGRTDDAGSGDDASSGGRIGFSGN